MHDDVWARIAIGHLTYSGDLTDSGDLTKQGVKIWHEWMDNINIKVKVDL